MICKQDELERSSELEPPAHVTDQMHDVRVALHHHELRHLDAAEAADPADVVAPEIHEHHVLRPLLRIRPHLVSQPVVLLLVPAARVSARVRDISELLVVAGPAPAGKLPLRVTYDAPCHLEHAQGVREAPLTVLGAIPGLRVQRLPGSERCWEPW